jgi:hypothetical protein
VFGPKAYGRKAGKPVTIVDTFTVLSPSAKYTLQVANRRSDPHHLGHDNGDDEKEEGGVPRALFLINSVRFVAPGVFNGKVFLLNLAVTTVAWNKIGVESLGRTTEKLTLRIFGVGNNPPPINAFVSSTVNATAWSNITSVPHLTTLPKFLSPVKTIVPLRSHAFMFSFSTSAS